MKRQNGVVLSGMLTAVRTEAIRTGDLAGTVVYATLITDHITYGGHHQVLFVAESAVEMLVYWALTDGKLEVTVEGWLRATPARGAQAATAVVVADRVLFLNVTQVQRETVARHKAARRAPEAQGGPPARKPPASQAGRRPNGAARLQPAARLAAAATGG